MVAAPAHAEPEVRARASMDRVIPQGTRMVARPSRAGASAEEDRARPRTKRSHEAGGSMRRSRNPGTRSWASPNATTSRPAPIWARVVHPVHLRDGRPVVGDAAQREGAHDG